MDMDTDFTERRRRHVGSMAGGSVDLLIMTVLLSRDSSLAGSRCNGLTEAVVSPPGTSASPRLLTRHLHAPISTPRAIDPLAGARPQICSTKHNKNLNYSISRASSSTADNGEFGFPLLALSCVLAKPPTTKLSTLRPWEEASDRPGTGLFGPAVHEARPVANPGGAEDSFGEQDHR
ncbi:uncharacterized protein B0I36DRAFT_353738 [Microdochium trichocladiopsis]|uniref:Uncharacterized protein n=1 Tax=Microdochium trichocladiopsis TaxID=1682393 RepID=A0A9P8XVP9_9PEZI|nr:uncharacterized protein B0I36DRAFT_353738 [Microdochium trichocladiopsis]KAH7021019.1 hypothetical protein B0I36DRAFT_353738 [Microdochium trichocladiopsis]